MAGRILLEVCVDDAEGLEAAIAGGADRIELCSALELGGLTPSAGLMRRAGEASVPVYAMMRPRAGDFAFDASAIDVIRRDIDAAREAGLAGVVLGASLADGRLDEATLRLLCAHARGLGLTLHRVFDLVPEPLPALEAAIALGFERVLTSGGAVAALDGLDMLAALAAAAAGRIVIMPGGGVGLEAVGVVLARTGAKEVHSSCSVPRPAPSPIAMAMGFAAAGARETDRSMVAALRHELDELAAGATG